MRIIFVAIVSILSIMTVSAQKGTASVDGIIIDTANKQPIEFATIALVHKANKQTLDGTVTDEKGAFEIKNILAGTYDVEIDFLGFTKKVITITLQDGAKLKLNKIFLSSASTTLKEITIEDQSQVIEEKVDRLVYNAEKDINSKGGDASDVMRNVPLLTVDLEGNVSLRGNSNVKVLINNKPSSIMAGSVADALKQIPADQIKTIEVITSPGARYESEGTSGIINIITKKQTLEGMTLGVDISAGNRGSMLGLNGNYRRGKMGLSLRGHGRAEYNVKGAFENIQNSTTPRGLQSTTQSASTLTNRMHGNYNFGWDYDFSKKSSFSAGLRLGSRNGLSTQDNFRTSILLPNSTTPLISARNVDSKDLSFSYDINTSYTYSFNPEKEFSVLGLYSRNNRNNSFEADLLNNVDFQTISSREKNDNISFNEESALEVNYLAPTSKLSQIEFGGKGIFRKVNSDFQYFISEGPNSEFIVDNKRNNNALDYLQSVGAGYLSYTISTRNKFTIKAGTRLEYTDINADFATGSADVIPSYWSFIPSLNLSQPVSKKVTVKAAYGKRIQRPGIQFLNPNVNLSNPTNISYGNPYLSPELTDNYELSSSFNLKGVFLTTAVFYRHTGNSITSLRDTFSVLNSTGTDYIPAIRTTYENIGRENTLGFNAFGNVTLFKIWQINGGFDVYNVSLTNNNPNPNYTASNNGIVIGGRLFTNIRFKNGWGLQGGGGGRGRQVSLQGTSGGFQFYSLGLRKNFKDGKGNFSISAENFFNYPFNQKSNSSSPLFSQSSINSFYNAGIRAGISYRFGKMNFADTKRRKSINNDDLKGEGGGQGGDGGGNDGAATQNQGGNQRGGGQRPTGQAPAGQNMQRPAGTTTQPGQAPQPTSGQPSGTFGGNQRPQIDPAQMHKDLGLSDDQKTKFDGIDKKYQDMRQAMMTEMRNGGDREAMRAKMESMRTEQLKELESILTPEQLTKYKEIQAKRAEQMRAGGGFPRQ